MQSERSISRRSHQDLCPGVGARRTGKRTDGKVVSELQYLSALAVAYARSRRARTTQRSTIVACPHFAPLTPFLEGTAKAPMMSSLISRVSVQRPCRSRRVAYKIESTNRPLRYTFRRPKCYTVSTGIPAAGMSGSNTYSHSDP